jgi:flagellar biosynthetic protein FliP
VNARSVNVAGAAIGLGLLALVAASLPAAAQSIDLNALIPGGNESASGRIIQLVAVITVLSIAPGLLIMVTSFTRFVIALSFLRSGLGLQSTPANLVLISLSLFMTFYVMAPTFDKAWENGVKPLTENAITEEEAFIRITDPFRDFMMSQVRPVDLKLFADLAATRLPPGDAAAAEEAAARPDLRVLIPAFMISELRRAFEIGFLIILPFLVIDMVVATLTMSMGMMMMPPAIIAMPFKILFFILMDGWNLVVSGLVRSFF